MNPLQMKIENGSTVTLTYSLRVEGFEGEVWEQIPNDEPMVIVIGEGEVLEKFEQSLVGQEKGNKFQVMIPCADAYGPEDPEAIFELPKDSVKLEDDADDEDFMEGELVSFQVEGEELYGVIVEYDLNKVTVDCNHPFADEDLYFDIKIIDVTR